MSRVDVPVTQERVDELASVRGFIDPVFLHEDPVTGRQHRLIRREDAERIAQGYACGECGAIYDMVMLACAVCRQPIALDVVPGRPEWGQHLRDRDEGFAAPVASPDDFIADVMADPDIEQIKLSKL